MGFFDSEMSLSVKWILIWVILLLLAGMMFGQWCNNKIREQERKNMMLMEKLLKKYEPKVDLAFKMVPIENVAAKQDE